MLSDKDRADLVRAIDHQVAGRPEAAETVYRELLARGARAPQIAQNLALILCADGRLAEAESHLRAALELRPDYAVAWNSLGGLLRQLQRHDEAIACFEKAVAYRPGYVEPRINHAGLLRHLGRVDASVSLFEAVLRDAPHNADALKGYGEALAEMGQASEGIAALAKATAVAPGSLAAQCALLLRRLAACDWTDPILESAILDQLSRQEEAIPPYSALKIGTTRKDQLFCARMHATAVAQANPLLPAAVPRDRERIRLGYLSRDLREHATAHLAAELFERHDRQRFEVIAYSYGHDDGSPMRHRLRGAFDRFVDIQSLRDEAAALAIRADDIDILIDLNGHTPYARNGIIARRPARVQVNYLGHPGTMGATFIDYLVADPILIPPEHRDDYAERIAYLPCYQPNDSRRAIGATPTRAACGLPENGFVFASFNGSHKFTAPWFGIWMRLLAATPDSVLWLLDDNPIATANLQRAAVAAGVDPTRLVFAPRLSLPDHLARQRNADLMLDTFPCNAHTTMSDGLWSGVPAVTCLGQTFAGRVGGSLLAATGLQELITTDAVSYERLARTLAQDAQRLKAIRAKLANPSALPLFDIARYTRDLEATYETMWSLWEDGAPPRHIETAR